MLYQRTSIPRSTEQLIDQQMNLIDDISYEYGRNMRSYSQTVQNLVECIQSSQNILHNAMLMLPVNYNQPVRSEFVGRQTPNSYTNVNTPPTTTAPSLFSYYVYPMNDLSSNSNIPTVMTPDQINIATENITYTFSTMLDATSCPISLEDFSYGEVLTRINHCGHIFKTQPLMNWFRRDHRCPVCRANLIMNPSYPNRRSGPAHTMYPVDASMNRTSHQGNVMRSLSRNLGRTIGTELMGIMNNLTATNPEINDFIYSFDIPIYDASNNNI